jgi:repressor LexA
MDFTPEYGLTEKQAEILNYIRTYIHAEGMPPTRAEMAQAFGWKSPNAAECHLRRLAKKKVLELIPAISRGIKLKQ